MDRREGKDRRRGKTADEMKINKKLINKKRILIIQFCGFNPKLSLFCSFLCVLLGTQVTCRSSFLHGNRSTV